MKKFLALIAVISMMVVLPGCGNLSPRQEQDIDNKDGRINQLENMANSIKLELGKVQSQNDIQDSKIGQMQQGLLNNQSNYENTGVQILSGPGGILVSVVALIGMVIIVLHYRKVAKINEKTADIMAQTIAEMNDPVLEDHVFRACLHTETEESVLQLMRKHKS